MAKCVELQEMYLKKKNVSPPRGGPLKCSASEVTPLQTKSCLRPPKGKITFPGHAVFSTVWLDKIIRMP
jgi:hypothetical protein